MPLSELQTVRQDKAGLFRAAGLDPYPGTSGRTHSVEQALELFAQHEPALESGAEVESAIVVAGRVTAVRHMGKATFVRIRDGRGDVQLYVRKDALGDESYERFLRLFDLGDIVEASGHLFRTRAGEVTVRTDAVTMLSKALNAPPEKWHGLTNIETRYRQRYADLIANEDIRNVFAVRSKTVSEIRRFLDDRGYMEVETPTLQPLYGGAAARPFTTRHNALDQTFYLRIADELYLKRLVVGGFERVYEICKDFRNEGMDQYHSPEFTMLEFYQAYADYRDVMRLVEELISAVTGSVLGSQVLHYQGKDIDVSPPWKVISLRDAIRDASGVDYSDYPDSKQLLVAARKAGADIPSGLVWPRIVDELLKQFVRPELIQPTFLVDYPVALSPLAKRKADDPTHAERFQPFIGGGEIGNGFTELNDPLDQLKRFQEQQRDREAGDEEAMPIDTDFINALMYGMPPTGGMGIGIDRLVMLLTNQDGVRDVVLFPAMRNLPPEADPLTALGDISL